MPVCLLLGFQHDSWRPWGGGGSHVMMGFDVVYICC